MVVGLAFDGERVVPGKTPIYLMWAHAARYRYIEEQVRGATVLDAGCGEGYGSYHVAQYARKVIGIDCSQEDIRHAGETYVRENLAFLAQDCRQLGFRDNSFDVVCSFEVIEHFEPADPFLSEVRRVLRPEGKFFVSTPNKASRLCSVPNPFHQRDYDLAGFLRVLGRHFPRVECAGQFCRRRFREFLFVESTRVYLKWGLYRRLLNRLAPLYFRGDRADTNSSDPGWFGRIDAENFSFKTDRVDRASYLLATCYKGE